MLDQKILFIQSVQEFSLSIAFLFQKLLVGRKYCIVALGIFKGISPTIAKTLQTSEPGVRQICWLSAHSTTSFLLGSITPSASQQENIATN
jgi:hypothetical protein